MNVTPNGSVAETSAAPEDDRTFDPFLARVNARFLANVVTGNPLFRTEGPALFDIYLAGLPAKNRQYHNCNACRSFFNRYADLVTIDELGVAKPAMWDLQDVPTYYRKAISNVIRAVRSRDIFRPFVAERSETVLGTPCTGPWTHYAVAVLGSMHNKDELRTGPQVEALKVEDFKSLRYALKGFSIKVLKLATTLLEADVLARSEKFADQAKWLLDLKMIGADELPNSTLLWRAVATAPAGWCHPRTTMIGTLLSDLEAGKLPHVVAQNFAQKMNPMKYQRPQAAPSAGNVAQAEKVFEALGLETALKRRYAVVQEVEALWRTKPEFKSSPRPQQGIFRGVKTKPVAPAPNPTPVQCGAITWTKFATQVLPQARTISYYVSPQAQPFYAMTTAHDPDARKILQWDNHVSWFTPEHASAPSEWSLQGGIYVSVMAIANQPSMWGENGGRFNHHGQSVFLLLRGAKPAMEVGSALFPEQLRQELHGSRATIEEYSRTHRMLGRNAATACGIRIVSGAQPYPRLVRVGTDAGTLQYSIDRWD